MTEMIRVMYEAQHPLAACPRGVMRMSVNRTYVAAEGYPESITVSCVECGLAVICDAVSGTRYVEPAANPGTVTWHHPVNGCAHQGHVAEHVPDIEEAVNRAKVCSSCDQPLTYLGYWSLSPLFPADLWGAAEAEAEIAASLRCPSRVWPFQCQDVFEHDELHEHTLGGRYWSVTFRWGKRR